MPPSGPDDGRVSVARTPTRHEGASRLARIARDWHQLLEGLVEARPLVVPVAEGADGNGYFLQTAGLGGAEGLSSQLMVAGLIWHSCSFTSPSKVSSP